MHFPIVQQYKTDILNVNPDNEIKGEPKEIPANKGSYIVVPRHAPFFVDSLKLYTKKGVPLEAKDWEVFRLMPKLTGLCGKPVACFIEIKNKDLDEILWDYDTVGEFSLIDNTFLQLMTAAINDERPVWWENIKGLPTVFPPTLHGHSLLADVTSFQDTIDFLNDLITVIKAKGRGAAEVQLQHYIDLVRHYVDVYGGMLKRFLTDHVNSYNEHGLTAQQIGLENADNFSSAIGSDVLKPLTDKHVTVGGLKTIIEAYGFNSSEFLEANVLPISRYGNTNFIPPAIDGSYEGLGGSYETSGICLETDGTLVYIAQRFDGRVRGLYYTIANNWENSRLAKDYALSFTAARYTHPFFERFSSVVDRIVCGSGKDVIMVCDSVGGKAFVGKTNGTFNPTKHVYNEININGLLSSIHSGTINNPGAYFSNLSIARMGNWVYIFYAFADADGKQGMVYRSIWRFPFAAIDGGATIVPVRVNTSYVDCDGVQWTNSDRWRWCTPIFSGTSLSRWIFGFSVPVTAYTGAYRSQSTVVVPHRDKPGIFVVKFLSWYFVGIGIFQADTGLEATYEFNPETNVFIKVNSTSYKYIDTSKPFSFQAEASVIRHLTAQYNTQGMEILPNGVITSLIALEFNGYPRALMFDKSPQNRSAFETAMEFITNRLIRPDVVIEPIKSPVRSSINPSCYLFDKEGSYYVAGLQNDTTTPGLFFKKVSGRFQVRAGVNNLLYPNLLSQPLTSDIRKVNLPDTFGGSWCSTSTGELSTYGVDVGDMGFCCGLQNSSIDFRAVGSAPPINGLSNVANREDIKLISRFTRKIEADESITIVPTEEITYPKTIVDILKANVQYPALMNASYHVHVCISDPNGKLTDTFGVLPVVAIVMYYANSSIYSTTFVLNPTYSNTGGQRTVTSISIATLRHDFLQDRAIDNLGYFSNGTVYPRTRCLYYKTGNTVSVYLYPGVTTSIVGNSVTALASLTFNTSNGSVSFGGLGVYPVGDNLVEVAPGIGLIRGLRQGGTTGGAGTIYVSGNSNFLFGSLYPETGWIVFFINSQEVVFNAKQYVLPSGTIDLRDIDANPANKTFYIYARLSDGKAGYVVTQEKLMESAFNLWIGTIKTNLQQIQTIERFNVFVVNGHRVSETKRGNSIPASSGVINTEGQVPWLKRSELLP